jgi:hypothetical protein
MFYWNTLKNIGQGKKSHDKYFSFLGLAGHLAKSIQKISRIGKKACFTSLTLTQKESKGVTTNGGYRR